MTAARSASSSAFRERSWLISARPASASAAARADARSLSAAMASACRRAASAADTRAAIALSSEIFSLVPEDLAPIPNRLRRELMFEFSSPREHLLERFDPLLRLLDPFDRLASLVLVLRGEDLQLAPELGQARDEPIRRAVLVESLGTGIAQL